jgi:anti-sigma regulatory factor (Ser/Thr protein kinase)
MPSRREAVAPAVERILRAATGAGLNAEQRDNLAVASAEALSNAAVHGNRLEPGRPVRVMVMVKRMSCAIVEVTDSGPGFDIAGLIDPTDPHHLLAPGGRGVFLMRRLVDGVEYNRQGNRVRLTVHRHRRARAGGRSR